MPSKYTLPDNEELRRLGEKAYGEHFPRIFNDQTIPLLELNFGVSKMKTMRDNWREQEILETLKEINNE